MSPWGAAAAAFLLLVFGACLFYGVVMYVPGVWQWLEKQRRD
jgi:hypothetical protein